MARRVIILFAAVVACALWVVQLRQQNRVAFAQLQSLQNQRDNLDIEWGRLLLEEGAWSQHRRVAALARARLGMELPDASHIQVIRLPANPKP